MINVDYKKRLENLFGERWLENQAESFLKQRFRISEKNKYNPEIQNLEKKTHPIIRDILSHFTIEDKIVDLSRLTNKCKAELEINLLGRDLDLLWKELNANRNIFDEYVRELKITDSYDQRRFELFVAANFKLQGFSVCFIERNAREERHTPEFTAKKDKFSLEVECKQRFQRNPDLEREKFLYLLTANLFPRLLTFNLKQLIIEIIWNGRVQFNKVNILSNFIVEKVMLLTSKSENYFEDFKLILRTYKAIQLLPKILQDFQKNEPNYITTTDSYLAAHKGLFLSINRDISSSITKRMRQLISIAKKQLINSEHKAIYLDVGTLPLEVINKFDQIIKAKPPEKLDLLVTLKHQLHIDGNREILFTPFTKIMWNRKLMPNSLIVKSIPGFIGESGFDSYIQEFVS